MKLAPVSADLLIKLAVAALAVGAVWYTVRKVKNAAGDMVDSAVGMVESAGSAISDAAGVVVDKAGEAAQAINPMNQDNVAYHTVNVIGGELAGDTSGSWTLGGWIYDITH